MGLPLISVATWDAGFRESYHTVDCFARQDIAAGDFEFTWADYYDGVDPVLREKVEGMGNGRVFEYGGEGDWHLGRCLNAAIRECRGNILVIPDGDVAIADNFLREVARCFRGGARMALYFRRWDEPASAQPCRGSDIAHLKELCRLNNPTNYGGCLALPRACFEEVGGYEEHDLFSGAGAIGLELYTRLKNAGFPIMWHPSMKIFHPWHEGTMPGEEGYRRKVKMQNWVIRQRDLDVASRSDPVEVQALVDRYETLDEKSREGEGLVTRIRRLLGI